MSMICKEAEEYLDYEAVHKKIKEAVALPLSTIESEAASVFLTAWKLNAKAIVVVTKGGYTAELVAKYRPSVPILTVVDQECPDAGPAEGTSRATARVPVSSILIVKRSNF